MTLKIVHKLIILVIIPIILSIAIFGTTSYFIFKEELIEARTEEATSLITLASEEVRDPLYFLDLEKLKEIIQNIKENPNVESVYIMTPEGRVITDGTDENKFYNQNLKDEFSKKSIKSDELLVEVEKDVLQISTPVIITEKIGIMRLDFSLKELHRVFSHLVITLGTIGAIISVAVVFIGIFISRSISEPVIKARNAAIEIAQGDLNKRIESVSKDEIGQLADAFNNMTESLQMSVEKLEESKKKIEEAYSLREYFLKETSHRIISPVAIIGAYTDLLLDSSNLNDVQKERIRTIQEKNDEIQKLLKDALEGTYLEEEEERGDEENGI